MLLMATAAAQQALNGDMMWLTCCWCIRALLIGTGLYVAIMCWLGIGIQIPCVWHYLCQCVSTLPCHWLGSSDGAWLWPHNTTKQAVRDLTYYV